MSRFAPRGKVEIRKAPVTESSAFPNFKKMEFKAVKDDEEVSNIVDRMLALGAECYMAFIILSRDDLRKRELGPRQYDLAVAEEIKKIYPTHSFVTTLEGFFVRSLVKAAAQLAASVVFSNDDGRVHSAMSGNAAVVNSYWEVNKFKKERVVQPITSAHAADMQLFCASVDQGKTQTQLVNQETGVYQTVSVPSLVPKNRVEFVRIEYALKTLFTGLLVFEGDPTDETIKAAPWIWKAIYETVRSTRLPITGLPLPLIYLTFVQKSFDYRPFPVNVLDLFYKNYDNLMKELIDQVAKHAVYRGGYFVNKYYYFNVGLRNSTCKVIGGPFPVKWCSYNTNKKVTWEREGAFIEGGNLETIVNPARPYSEFDGLFYDPALCVEQLSKCAGLIIPYDKNANGLAVLEKWVIRKAAALNKKVRELRFLIYATYGPAPLLWIINDTTGEVGSTGPFLRPVVDTLWKTMGSMALYNFCCSLNALAIKEEHIWSSANDVKPRSCAEIWTEWKGNGIPLRPVDLARWDPAGRHTYEVTIKGATKSVQVPTFYLIEMEDNILPGRHRIDAAVQRRKNERADGAYDDYQDFAAAEAPPEDTADEKRKKQKPNEHADENPYDAAPAADDPGVGPADGMEDL